MKNARKAPSARHPTNDPRPQQRQKWAHALRLRKKGATYQEIANHLHISKATAYTYVTNALKEITREPAEELLALENERLDHLLKAIYPLAELGKPDAIRLSLEIMTKIERLNGIENPQNKDQTNRADELLTKLLQESLQANNTQTT